MTMIDEFDAPNTKAGLCPDCGQQANIWDVMRNRWECSYCNWTGTKTKQPENENEQK